VTRASTTTLRGVYRLLPSVRMKRALGMAAAYQNTLAQPDALLSPKA
jgi:hypothetical protein